jgi:hypothetical protein
MDAMSAASGHDVASGTDRLSERAGWILAIPAAAALVAGAWASSVPGGYFDIGIWVVLAWLALGLCWLGTVIVTLVRDHRAGRLRAGRYWRFGLLPAIFLVAVLVAELDLPQRLRFELDRPELEAYAGQVRAEQVDQLKPGRIGTLPVSLVQNREGCVSFVVSGAGFISQTGYAHCIGTPRTEFGYTFTHVTGPWYTWYYSD